VFVEQEFDYRLAGRIGGWRPGSHPSRSAGDGQQFVAHARLFDRPDPRRLDLRASLRSVDGDWLVRVNRMRAGVPVHAVVDVSASMLYGRGGSKLDYARDFVAALGRSAFRIGDAAGLVAFDAREREDLAVPATRSRGSGQAMAEALARVGDAGRGGIDGLDESLARLAARRGLVFILSDFHWPLDRLGGALDRVASSCVIPVITWHRAETEPPETHGLVALRDAETGRQRTLWLRPSIRAAWRERVAARRAQLDRILSRRGLRPFYAGDRFEATAVSRFFLEAAP